MEHDHDKCRICSVNRLGCNQVRRELQELLDEGTIEILQNRNVDEDEPEVNVISLVFKLPEPVVIRYDSSKPKTSPSLVIKPAGPVPYSSDKAVPFRHNPVVVQDGVEVPLPSTAVTNIADVSGLTRSGRVFSAPAKAPVASESAERPVGTAVNIQNPAFDVTRPSSIQKTPTSSQSLDWTEDCQKAFDSIKEYLSEPPILSPPVEGRPLIMYLTVLEDSMGCVLGQQDESGKKEFAIYYLSKKFTDCESRYSMLEKTCCALVWAAKRLRQYMINHTTWLISRMDPIKYIFEKPALTGRIARWQMLLSEYDIEYRAQKAIKGSILADHLAYQPIEDHQSIQYDFPDEEILYLKMKDCDEPTLDEGPEPGSRWTMVFDGAVNQYGNGIGAVIVTPQGTHIPFTARLTFKCTNNMAEYEACIMGLEECIDLRIKHLDVYGDSALVVNQIKGEWETNQPSLIPYRDYARRISTFFTEVDFHHIPREDNRMADALATLASMIVVKYWNEVPNIVVMRLDRPTHIFAIEEVNDDKPWYFDIKNFLQNQVYPPGASVKDRKTLRRLSGSFYLSGEVLYKRNFDMVLLRCVDRH
ncbi:uncharacterized protein LOC127081785, partial [Lathyrus oleraceus]|uniref:uncharacterized protein LOC127081785 n=1 Tax=Pisum sativum TaxID=3888 RepID=UPI0021D1A901